MAWTRVQGGSNSSGAASASTIAVTISAVGSGNAICGALGWDRGGGVSLTSVTDDKGNTYNLESVVSDVGYVEDYCAFSRTNITNAPTVITANFSASVDFRFILVDEFSGGSTASTDERDSSAHGGQLQTAPGTGTDGVTSGTFTTTINGDLIWGSTVDTNLATNGTGFSTGTTDTTESGFSKQTAYRTQATAGSGTATTFTANINDHHVTFMIALKPPAAGGAIAAKRYIVNQAIKRASYW